MMSCTNQLGCLMQWQQRSNPIQPEDTHSAQGPSDSTRHLFIQKCFQLIWQIIAIRRLIEMCYTWSLVQSSIVRVVSVFQQNFFFPMLMNGKLCKVLIGLMLKGYLCIDSFYSLHSTADVLEEVSSTAAHCTSDWGLCALRLVSAHF